MKKVKIIAGFLILFSILNSCSSSDSNINDTSIVGEWKLVGLNSSLTGDYHRDCNLLSRITFSSNSTFNSKQLTYDSSINDCFEENITGNYTINNNELSLESNVFTFELTETTLCMSQIPNINDGITYKSSWERVN